MPLILAGVHIGGMMWSYYSYTYEEKILNMMVKRIVKGNVSKIMLRIMERMGVMVISPNKTVDTMLETRKKKINVES